MAEDDGEGDKGQFEERPVMMDVSNLLFVGVVEKDSSFRATYQLMKVSTMSGLKLWSTSEDKHASCVSSAALAAAMHSWLNTISEGFSAGIAR